MVDDLEEGATEMKKDIFDLNSELKAVLSKMREPGKICIDIILMVVLAVVIGVLIWGVKFYMSLASKST